MTDFETRRLAKRYADEPDFKREVDAALGVFHVPACKPGECDLCDAKREREVGHITDGLLGGSDAD